MFTPSKSPAFDYPTVNASQTALNQAAFSYDEQFTRAITIGQQQEISEIKKRNPQAILLVGDDRAGYVKGA